MKKREKNPHDDGPSKGRGENFTSPLPSCSSHVRGKRISSVPKRAQAKGRKGKSGSFFLRWVSTVSSVGGRRKRPSTWYFRDAGRKRKGETGRCQDRLPLGKKKKKGLRLAALRKGKGRFGRRFWRRTNRGRRGEEVARLPRIRDGGGDGGRGSSDLFILRCLRRGEEERKRTTLSLPSPKGDRDQSQQQHL